MVPLKANHSCPMSSHKTLKKQHVLLTSVVHIAHCWRVDLETDRKRLLVAVSLSQLQSAKRCCGSQCIGNSFFRKIHCLLVGLLCSLRGLGACQFGDLFGRDFYDVCGMRKQGFRDPFLKDRKKFDKWISATLVGTEKAGRSHVISV